MEEPKTYAVPENWLKDIRKNANEIEFPRVDLTDDISEMRRLALERNAFIAREIKIIITNILRNEE